MNKKQDLKALNLNKLKKWFKKNNWPEYRGEQVFNWIYKNGIENFEEMENIPQKLIEFMKKNCYLTNMKMIDKKVDKDGTIKYLWKLNDNETIESVYLPTYKENRHSICISSQVGCALNCKFCATGMEGIIRNLTPGEIVDQVYQIQKDISESEFGEPAITNVVYMGMGEPFKNLDNVLESIFIINENKGFNIGMRKITISTAGIVPEINKFAQKDLQTGLAVSLNAPNNKLRNKLMPINKKYPLEELISAVEDYIEITNRRVTFEYILIKNQNDSYNLAYQLVELLRDLNCHINLIPANPLPELNIEKPSETKINEFKNILADNNLTVTVRRERGIDIKAACGQLRSENH